MSLHSEFTNQAAEIIERRRQLVQQMEMRAGRKLGPKEHWELAQQFARDVAATMPTGDAPGDASAWNFAVLVDSMLYAAAHAAAAAGTRWTVREESAPADTVRREG